MTWVRCFTEVLTCSVSRCWINLSIFSTVSLLATWILQAHFGGHGDACLKPQLLGGLSKVWTIMVRGVGWHRLAIAMQKTMSQNKNQAHSKPPPPAHTKANPTQPSWRTSSSSFVHYNSNNLLLDIGIRYTFWMKITLWGKQGPQHLPSSFGCLFLLVDAWLCCIEASLFAIRCPPSPLPVIVTGHTDGFKFFLLSFRSYN